MGEGYAGAAIRSGRVYVLDYDQENHADALRCLSLADGQEIWRYTYPVKVKRNHGMSRTVPAVSEQSVVSLGPKCHVLCLDAVSGQLRWMIDLVRQFGATAPPWYAGQCPLIDQERAILAPGGDALMIAVDCQSGKVLWSSPNPRGWKMTHSSIVPMTLGEQRMYVYCGSGGVVGVGAEDGAILWETTDWRIDIATIPSPVDVGNGRLFLSGGYGAGSMMLAVTQTGTEYRVEPLFTLKPSVFGATQHTPVFHGGFLYGVRADGQLTCLDVSGQVRWTSGPAVRFGLGPFMLAEELILVLDGDGKLTLVEATPDAYRPLAEAQVLDGHDSWGPMALVGGRLIVRDLTEMACLNVSRP